MVRDAHPDAGFNLLPLEDRRDRDKPTKANDQSPGVTCGIGVFVSSTRCRTTGKSRPRAAMLSATRFDRLEGESVAAVELGIGVDQADRHPKRIAFLDSLEFHKGFHGGCIAWTRTRDEAINDRPLYQLSYDATTRRGRTKPGRSDREQIISRAQRHGHRQSDSVLGLPSPCRCEAAPSSAM